jgi:hypothetical protein
MKGVRNLCAFYGDHGTELTQPATAIANVRVEGKR